jgi:hypothetical protein
MWPNLANASSYDYDLWCIPLLRQLEEAPNLVAVTNANTQSMLDTDLVEHNTSNIT